MSEADAAGCLPKGEYDFTVAKAEEKVSKSSGNEMIELTLTVYGQGGREVTVRDWLVATDGGQYKVQRFCKSVDLWDTYNAGELCDRSCVGLSGTVKLVVDDQDGEYQPRNKVVDYMPNKLTTPAQNPPERSRELPGVSESQRVNAPARADMTKPPTQNDIPF